MEKLVFCVYVYIYIYPKIYRTIILPVILYGFETWSLTLREERKLEDLSIHRNTHMELSILRSVPQRSSLTRKR